MIDTLALIYIGYYNMNNRVCKEYEFKLMKDDTIVVISKISFNYLSLNWSSFGMMQKVLEQHK